MCLCMKRKEPKKERIVSFPQFQSCRVRSGATLPWLGQSETLVDTVEPLITHTLLPGSRGQGTGYE